MDTEKIIKAGKITKQVREWIKPQIKKEMPLLKIAELIENKIIELKGEIAFPTNLSINEISAHSTPSYNDETKAHGLLKVDFGVHIQGFIADNAFSIDLENSQLNNELIKASEKALENALKIIKLNSKANEIGKTIQQTAISFGFKPIANLGGHQIEQYELHTGIRVPNIEDKNNSIIPKGLFAIEPFITKGVGSVHDGKSSGIYELISERQPRTPLAREVLIYIIKQYQTLPFCSRWLIKVFGTKALLALSQLEQNNNLHHFKQLVESSKSPVAQSEHTVLIDKEKIITTL